MSKTSLHLSPQAVMLGGLAARLTTARDGLAHAVQAVRIASAARDEHRARLRQWARDGHDHLVAAGAIAAAFHDAEVRHARALRAAHEVTVQAARLTLLLAQTAPGRARARPRAPEREVILPASREAVIAPEYEVTIFRPGTQAGSWSADAPAVMGNKQTRALVAGRLGRHPDMLLRQNDRGTLFLIGTHQCMELRPRLQRPPTAGQVLAAALATYGWRFRQGNTGLIVAMDDVTPWRQVDAGTHVRISAGEDEPARHHPQQHAGGWSARLCNGETRAEELCRGTGGDCARDSAACARALTEWKSARGAVGRDGETGASCVS